MTKENFINKWAFVYNVNDTTNPYFIADLEAVIATEIAKAQEVKPEEPEQPTLNPIEQAYERGEKIRAKDWAKNSWVRKNSDNSALDEKGNSWYFQKWSFKTHPENWEIYTEPEQVAEPAEQPAKPFDKDRFEAMFRAVVETKKATINALEHLNSYYASKEGGANG